MMSGFLVALYLKISDLLSAASCKIANFLSELIFSELHKILYLNVSGNLFSVNVSVILSSNKV